MTEHPIWSVDNRNPSISETITSGGEAVDLTSSSVRFLMRPVGGTALTVAATATIVSATLGSVRYDWTADDVDDPGLYLVWWEVTTGGKTQDVMEAIIEFRAHAPELYAYVEVEELKSTLTMTGQTFADLDILNAVVAASRGIDEVTCRRFYPDADATSERYYTYEGGDTIEIDDLIDLTSLTTAPLGDASYSDTWTENTDFLLEPLNSNGTTIPWNTIRVHPLSTLVMPTYPRAVKVTGQFGWTAPPAAVKTATTIIATRLLRRAREAPFGVFTVGLDGEAIRISRFDSDVTFLLAPYKRTQALIA